MGTAAAIRRLEQCARIVTTYEDALDDVHTRDTNDSANLSAAVEAIREMRYALNSLDIERCNEAPKPVTDPALLRVCEAFGVPPGTTILVSGEQLAEIVASGGVK